MSDTVIKVEELSKMYRLGTVGAGTLSSDVSRFIAKVRGKEDPTQKIGVNDRTTKSDSEFVWSLKDINFEIKQGDAVGIIGRNGAGKSTLLKILSRVTAPTTGSIKIKGRVASLLEVGTGFHPELSGRDNIFMNGAILGMSRTEIRSKFDEIVEFAGVEKYIDTPVKRYSSGMYVRLAFAVAAHLESEILIVDEVLAVGDAEFQKKCLDKMQSLNVSQNKTILFVTHNMALLKKLCNTGILLQNGTVKTVGAIDDVLGTYNQSNDVHSLFNASLKWEDNKFSNKLDLNGFELSDNAGVSKTTFMTFEEINLTFKLKVKKTLTKPRLVLFVHTQDGTLAFKSALNTNENAIDSMGTYSITCKIPSGLLNHGFYDVFIQIGEPGIGFILEKMFITRIESILSGTNGSDFIEKWDGVLCPQLFWEKETL